MENINLIIGTNIKDLRKANKLTQSELAEKLNYSNKAISRWESGEVIPDVLTLNKICEVFNIPLSQIFEPNVTEKKVKRNYKLQIGNKLAITLLAISMVWFIATIGFVYTKIIFNYNSWRFFVYAIPLSAIIGIIFNSIWGKKSWNFILISILIWTALTSVFITLINYHIWPIFLSGIPMQIAIIVGSNITSIKKE